MSRSSVIASNGGTPVDFATDNLAGVDVPLQKILLGGDNVDGGTLSDKNPMPIKSGVLDRILRALLAPLGYDKSLGRFRQTAVIESGTVTQVTTVTTVTTCTTVGTVTGLTNIDGRNGSMLINANSRAAWAMSHRACIT
jgi:hypothetical protein